MTKLMKTLMATATLALAVGSTAHAHLGWTLADCEAAWGAPALEDNVAGAPTYMFQIQSNLFAQVSLINSKVENVEYFSRSTKFLVDHAFEFLQKNYDGIWNVYDDGRGKQTAKTWKVTMADGGLIAYALLWSYPDSRGFYRLQISSWVWGDFVDNNGGNNGKPISNIDELNI